MFESGTDIGISSKSRRYTMNNIAIFGHKGFLGKQLTHYFESKGISCSGFDMPECDITSDQFWEEFCPEVYDAILFFSGLTGTEKSFTDAQRYLAVNESGLLNLLSKLVHLGVKSPRVIFPSSRLVYKGSEELLTEDAEKDTKTVYAVNKLACEGYLAAYSNRFGIPYNVIRICVPYGSIIATEYSYGTIGFFKKQATTGKIKLYGDGMLRRTFTHVADICNIVDKIVRQGIDGVFNIGGENLSLMEVASAIASKMNASVEHVLWPEEALRIESGSTCFDAGRLFEMIGYKEYRKLTEEL